jgi:hypothetical protein
MTRTFFGFTTINNDPFYLGTLNFEIMRGIISKGKANPLQAWTGPEGSRRLRFPGFKTVST